MPGIAASLLRGAHELPLGEETKASVARIEMALVAPEGDGGVGPMGAFFMDLANGVHAGKVDAAKISADYAAIDKAAAALHAREVAAIVGLHDALGPAERRALTADMHTKRAERERRFALAVGDAGGPDWGKVRLDRLTRDLSLDVDGGQQQKVSAVVNTAAKTDPQNPEVSQARRVAGHERFEAVLAAFAGDALDAGVLPSLPSGAKSLHEGPERTAGFYAQLLPLLKPEQRDKLGEQLLRVASRPGHFAEDSFLEGPMDDVAPAPPPAQ
jgi:hypothetical protein